MCWSNKHYYNKHYISLLYACCFKIFIRYLVNVNSYALSTIELRQYKCSSAANSNLLQTPVSKHIILGILLLQEVRSCLVAPRRGHLFHLLYLLQYNMFTKSTFQGLILFWKCVKRSWEIAGKISYADVCYQTKQ